MFKSQSSAGVSNNICGWAFILILCHRFSLICQLTRINLPIEWDSLTCYRSSWHFPRVVTFLGISFSIKQDRTRRDGALTRKWFKKKKSHLSLRKRLNYLLWHFLTVQASKTFQPQLKLISEHGCPHSENLYYRWLHTTAHDHKPVDVAFPCSPITLPAPLKHGTRLYLTSLFPAWLSTSFIAWVNYTME